ncbi:MAG: SAM-dependent chlorinase/fluorinase [Chloroflexi bacterium]|nr:SAM-dependent chlorinase/fluorinase [Chloroflexota bacterium]
MKPILVFQTDFTYKEGAVSSMYGVVKSVDRDLEIFDGTHEIPQYDIWSASYRLFQSMQFWPTGTVFVSVVDPGVGTSRKACIAITTDGYYVVSPDNGSLTHVKKWIGISAVRQIDETVNRLRGKNTEGTSVFHGRDLFGYCAARLASGLIRYDQVGPSYNVGDIVEFTLQEPTIVGQKVRGIFEIGDPNFGNLWTNVPLSLFSQAGITYGDHVQVEVRHLGEKVFSDTLLFERSFGFVQKGQTMIYNNELMKVSLAINQGSLVEQYHLGWGPDWEIEFEKTKK